MFALYSPQATTRTTQFPIQAHSVFIFHTISAQQRFLSLKRIQCWRSVLNVGHDLNFYILFGNLRTLKSQLLGCECNGETFLDQSSIEGLGSKQRCRLWSIVASLGFKEPGSYQGSKAQWFLYVPQGLTFSNSTFCPHSVFMCFVWI